MEVCVPELFWVADSLPAANSCVTAGVVVAGRLLLITKLRSFKIAGGASKRTGAVAASDT